MPDALKAKIEKLKKGYCEEIHPNSDLAKFMEKTCLKLIDEDPDFGTRKEFPLDTSSNELVWLTIFSQLIKEKYTIDYINDSFSIIDDDYASAIAIIYATYLFDDHAEMLNYYDQWHHVTNELISLDVIKSKLEPDALDYFEAAYYLSTGYHFMRDYADSKHNPICKLAESVYDMISSYRNNYNVDVEYNIWDHYDYIEDNIIYGLDKFDFKKKAIFYGITKDDDPNMIKASRIHILLYRIAALCDADALIEYTRLGKPLPKFIMIYLYIILNDLIRDDTDAIYLPLISGYVNEISDETLSSIEELIIKLSKDKFNDELFAMINSIIGKYLYK